MALNIEEKKTIVSDVNQMAEGALSLIALEYRGLSVSDITALRVKAREAGVALRVARNTLARRAFTGTSFECMNEQLVGPVMLAFSSQEVSAGARLVRDFIKTNDKLVVKALALNGQVYDRSHLEFVAKLPTRDEALARLLAVMKAPITKFVQTLAAPHTKFVRTLVAVREQKQQGQ